MQSTGGWRCGVPPESAGPDALARALGDAIVHSDVQALAVAREPSSFLEALVYTVSWAMYWQEPDDWDRRLAVPQVAEQLRPVAEAVAAAPAAQWWATPIDRADQQEVSFVFEDSDDDDDDDDRPRPETAREALAQWRAETVEGERDAIDWADDLNARITGEWWSSPVLGGLTCSTRTLGQYGPVGLRLVEDELGWQSARCRALKPRVDVSVFEVHGPADWAQLVGRYPLTVTNSRRHDWRRATGLDLPWAIPDYLAVAADYDAVHLSVVGYLTTAGRAVAAGDRHTVLAGWDPDQTWWLTDAPERSDLEVLWDKGPELEPLAWSPRRPA